MADGGTNPAGEAWRAAVIEYIQREARPVDKYGHQPRLYALTAKLARE